jgi:hypothetical protein
LITLLLLVVEVVLVVVMRWLVAAVQEVIVLVGTVRLVAVVVQAKLELLQPLLSTP